MLCTCPPQRVSKCILPNGRKRAIEKHLSRKCWEDIRGNICNLLSVAWPDEAMGVTDDLKQRKAVFRCIGWPETDLNSLGTVQQFQAKRNHNKSYNGTMMKLSNRIGQLRKTVIEGIPSEFEIIHSQGTAAIIKYFQPVACKAIGKLGNFLYILISISF